jgi:acetoin utilization deacetylase AcuC-like enzyme
MTFHEKFKQYDLGEGHPFRGDRFINAMNFFKEQSLLSLPQLRVVEPKPASKEDLLRVHSEDYVELIFRLAKENKPYDIETPVSLSILEAALLIVGGAIECGEAVLPEPQSVPYHLAADTTTLEKVMGVDSASSMT